MEGAKFLKQKYTDLHTSKEVNRAVKSHVRTKREKISNTAEDKIEVYSDRLEKLVLKGVRFSEKEGRFVDQNRKSFENSQRPRALFLLREKLMNKYVRNSLEKKTEGAIRVEERAARELGMGGLHYGEDEVNQRQEVLIQDVEKSLDAWILYFSDTNEPYPTWFRYYVFRNVLNMGDFDKDKKEFKKRSDGSAGLFPDIDRGALAYIEDMISASKDENKLQKLQNAQRSAANNDIKENEILTKERAEEFAKLSFGKQYVEAMKQNGEITPEMRAETRGKWIKYQQDTDPTALWSSLQNKGTAWCTKGYGTASTQLQSGDFYVYYTLDKKGEPTIPRIAIRMNGNNQIGEVRGVEDNQQNVEGNMMPILEEKFKDFGPEADKYKKKSSDMKRLTEIDNKIQKDEKTELTKEDLRFLYEVDSKIEGFGYMDDPRIKKILDKRNLEQDMKRLFEHGFTKEDLEKDELIFLYNIHGNKQEKDLKFFRQEILRKRNKEKDLENLFSAVSFVDKVLNLDSLENIENLKFPKEVMGLKMISLKSCTNIVFPNKIREDLILNNLISFKSIQLPEVIGGKLVLQSLPLCHNLIFPKKLNDLNLSSAVSCKGSKLPKELNTLNLDSLVSLEDLEMPNYIKSQIFIRSLDIKEKDLLKQKYPNLRKMIEIGTTDFLGNATYI